MSALEEIVVEHGARSGVTIAIAVHSTVLGPALGGARMWHYRDDEEAVADATRLAEAMTHKASAAGLDLGGGKGVIAAPSPIPPEGEQRRAILLDFGDLVDSLEGRYVTAEDVGTGTADMEVIAERTEHVVGLVAERGGSGDPSPVTALGVRGAVRACAAHRWGDPALRGRRVLLIGLGHVGTHLARLLVADGAELTVTDVDPGRRTVAAELDAEWIAPDQALSADCDVLAPCALGGMIDAAAIPRLRCEVLCGAANNVLGEEADAERLLRRGITYAPDFIANAGGLISVYGELHGFPHDEALRLAEGIETTIAGILAEAERTGATPLRAARRRSRARLEAASSRASVEPGGIAAEPAGIRMRNC